MSPTLSTLARPRSAKPGAINRMRAARPIPATHCVGIVTALTGDGLTVSSGGLQAPARRAASCLLEVAIGDTVACLQVAPDQWWILAVLQREDGVENVLRCQGDTRWEITDGALEFRAQSVGVRSEQFRVDTQDAELSADRARIVGRELSLVGATLKAVGTVLSTVFERVSHFSRQHSRRTEGIDRVSATHLEQQADQLLRLSGEHALINGDKLVKTRGSQIHFG